MLRVISDSVRERPTTEFRQTAEPARFSEGFYGEEWDSLDRFRWMGQAAQLEIEASSENRFLEMFTASEFHDLSQVLTISLGESSEDLQLVRGWSRISVPLPAGVESVGLKLNKIFPAAHYPEDSRTLGIRMRRPIVHTDARRHDHVSLQHQNGTLNVREMHAGATELESTPSQLGIDMYGVCNVKPPCVYCEWDWNKDLEGEFVDAPFTRETLAEWGEFFDNSKELVNCSIGEPFMMKNVDELFDIFGDSGKQLELTTNGQILTDRNIEKLLGRDIDLYISLDAGTPETYAKVRNDRLDKILANLKRLIAAKGGREGLPRVHLVFMPMKVNVNELEDFVKICADLDVDRMVLRPLNYSDSIDLEWDRGDYHYSYQEELLPFDQLVRVSGRAAELCRHYGVKLSDQMDFGGNMQELFEEEFAAGEISAAVPDSEEEAGEISPPTSDDSAGEQHVKESAAPSVEEEPPEKETAVSELSSKDEPLPSLGQESLPICTEPWKSLYILRRGILPCCYGAPVAEMPEYREAWNSPLVQDIRKDLTEGKFHRYCLNAPSCPIVRKSHQAQALPAAQEMFLRARKVWYKFDRAFGGVPKRSYLFARHVGSLVRARMRKIMGRKT